VLSLGPVATTIEVEEDVDAGPLGVLAAGLAVATTKVEEDIDGAPLGCCRQVWQRPPPKLKKMLMTAPPGSPTNGSGSGHHFDGEDINGGPS
jgi:hypothetical protein